MGPSTKRIAVIDALRTPFVKSFGVFDEETPLSLSSRVVQELVARGGVAPKDIDEVIWGAVIPQVRNGNLARDIVIYSGLPRSIPGFTLHKACTSALQAMQVGIDGIRAGRYQMVVAGGVEVMSDSPVLFGEEGRRFFIKMSRARSLGERLALAKAKLRPRIFAPKSLPIAEPSTGLSMGEHAEMMAVKNDISRASQDEYALTSHMRAAKAIAQGHLQSEIVPIWAGSKKVTCVDTDNLVRTDSSLESLATLRPQFDKKNGTITAGSSSGLTDGAAGVLLASEEYARAHNLPILGFICDSISIGVDPSDELLIGPAHAIPILAHRHGLKMEDIGVFELHEAFAAQVLSCLKKMSDDKFCQETLGLPQAFGRIPADKLNIDGGSLAYGHPLAASGARLVSRSLRVAKRVQSRYAMLAVCAAWGVGMAMLLEVE